MNWPPTLPGPTILRGVVGSTSHGLALEGKDDRDEMGVCVEAPLHVIGLQPYEQTIYRTAAEREHNPGAKSQAGDLDLCVYSLRKYCRLALKGNPTILLLLFLPAEAITTITPIGQRLREISGAFASRMAGGAFRGYIKAQRERLLGERGQKRTQRPELEREHGFDTKYAMHMLRLGYQGIEYMKTGRLSLPMAEPERGFLMEVRKGNVPYTEVISKAHRLEADLATAQHESPLPDKPNSHLVDLFLLDAYRESWGW